MPRHTGYNMSPLSRQLCILLLLPSLFFFSLFIASYSRVFFLSTRNDKWRRSANVEYKELGHESLEVMRCVNTQTSRQKSYLQKARRAGSEKPPLFIAAFSRLWPPPLHSPGGMQFHAAALYGGWALRGHRVIVFVTGPPSHDEKARKGRVLHYRVDPRGQLVLSDGEERFLGFAGDDERRDCGRGWKRGEGRLVVQQVSSTTSGEYSESWFEKTLELFRVINASLPCGFDVAHSESWAGVPHAAALQEGKRIDIIVTWHGSMMDWFRNEVNLVVHNVRLKNQMVGVKSLVRLKELSAAVAYEVFALQSISHHVVISDAAAADLRDIELVDDRSIHIIYNGVNSTLFAPPGHRATVRHLLYSDIGLSFSITDATLLIGCGGRLDGMKGHAQMARAMRLIFSRYPQVALVVTGTGAERWRYEALKKQGFRVVILGMLSQNQLAKFYQTLDIFVDPFYQHHGLNTVMLEAMMTGVALVVTQLPPANTTVPCVAYGLQFRLGDVQHLATQVGWLLDHSEERKAIGSRGRNRALHLFDSVTMSNAYETLLYDVVAGVSKSTSSGVRALGKVTCRRVYPTMCYRELTM